MPTALQCLTFLLLLSLYFPLSFCELNLDGYVFEDPYRDPCETECHCTSADEAGGPGYRLWSAKRYAVYNVWQEKRFVVNCTEVPHSTIPKNLPFNTTDLILADYNLGVLTRESFPDTHFPWNPMLLTVSLKNCSIDYLFPGAFQGNSFVSVRIIDLSGNVLESVIGGAFHDHQRLHNISID